MKGYLIVIRGYFRLISLVSPRLAAYQAFKLFQRPVYRIIRPLERSFYHKAHQFQLDHHPEPIDCFRLGDPEGPLVVLIHGWQSHAGSMSAIAASLADQGYQVVLFNLPAHGRSKQRYANLKTCSEALDRVLRYYQYSGVPSIISHSFGSAVATYTLAKKGYPIDKFIMLSTPDRILDIFKDFKKTISLGEEAFENMLSKVTQLLGEDLEQVAINSLTHQVRYRELNIIHDESDKVLPYSNSLNVYQNSRKATLTTIEKVGHYRMLWHNSVIKTIHLALKSNTNNAA